MAHCSHKTQNDFLQLFETKDVDGLIARSVALRFELVHNKGMECCNVFLLNSKAQGAL